MNLDPIKPYLKLIEVGLVVALLCGTFVAGCSHGENNKEKDVVSLTSQVDALTDANKQWAKDSAFTTKQAEDNLKLAQQKELAAAKSAEELRVFQESVDKKQAKWEADLANAKKEPSCQELLKQNFCSLVPLPSRP